MIKGKVRSGVVIVTFFLSIAFPLTLRQSTLLAGGGDGTASRSSGGFAVSLTSAEKAWLDRRPVLRVGGPGAFPPFHFIDEDGNAKGMAFDYLHFILEQVGLKVEMKRDLPWPDVLRKVRLKELDVITCVARTPAREAYLSFSEPLVSFPLVVVSRNDAPVAGGLAGLQGARVAFVRDNSVYEWIKRDQVNVTPYIVDSPLEALKAVSAGLADAHIENLAAAGYLIEKNGLANLKVSTLAAYGKYDLHFAVRNDWPELVSIVNKALAAMRPEQQAAIRIRWLPARYECGNGFADVWERIIREFPARMHARR